MPQHTPDSIDMDAAAHGATGRLLGADVVRLARIAAAMHMAMAAGAASAAAASAAGAASCGGGGKDGDAGAATGRQR